MPSPPSCVHFSVPRPASSLTRKRGSSSNSATLAPKRRKAASLSGTGRLLAALALLEEVEKPGCTQLAEDDDSEEDSIGDETLRLVSKLKSKLARAPASYSAADAPPTRYTSLWAADMQLLIDAGISWSPNFALCDLLVDQEDVYAQAQRCRSLNPPGSSMSSKDLGELLKATEDLYSTTAEAGSRIFVNLILLRVASMLGADSKRLVVFPKFTVPAVDLTPGASSATRAGGQVDYLAAVAPAGLARRVLTSPQILHEPCPLADAGLVTIVTKTSVDPDLPSHVPQAVLKVAALARIHNKRRMRGALTTGKKWVFFIFEAGLNGEGGTYCHSYPASIDGEDMRDAVTGVLKEWIEASMAE
ncbi:hypothetical protein BC834DRAFT_972707 [Gloeopeniophorella convolvens]|nr:hypothetical protein BC834DRAFT_972707 [Gloeopeniophorella convolvens]